MMFNTKLKQRNMKNKLLFGALLISIASLFTACSDDRDYNPTFQTPTEFKLNAPAMADQYIQLSEENTVKLTWSQPNYGYNAYATYRIQVGVVNADGSVKWNEKTIKDDNGNVTGTEPNYLASVTTACSANISGEEIAQALNQIDGFETIASYQDMGFRKIAFRVNSILYEALTEEVPGTSVFSNHVVFNNMAAYCAIKEKTWLYVVGSCTGWNNPTQGNAEFYEDWKVMETEVESRIFRGTFDMPAGDLQFRFYKAPLVDWDTNSWGPQKDDAAIDGCVFTNNTYNGSIMEGKGTWKFEGFAGGSVTLTVDLKKGTVNFTVN
jgi:hypothetical protein